jgi:hypothetical protein
MLGWALLTMHLAIASPEGAVRPGAAAQLDGSWVSDCLPIGQGGRHGYITTIRFDRDRIEARSQVYARNSCDTPTFRVDYEGRVIHLQALGDRTSLRHRALSVTLTPQDPSVVEIYNREGGGCGLRAWQIGAARSVAGRSCGPYSFPTEQSTLFDSIWTDPDGPIRFAAFPIIWIDDPEAVPAQPSENRFRRQAH